MSAAALCRTCGDEISYEPAPPGLAAHLRPSLCASCAAAGDASQAALLAAAEREARCLPPRYRDASFEAYAPRTPSQQLALEAMRAHAAEGVLLSGGAGCGKTHLACAAVAAGPAGSLFVNAAALLDDVRRGYDGEGQGLFVRALSAPLLALDDLGSEAVTDWVRDRIYALLNHRWDHCLPLLVTTNVAPADLAERIGQGVASRIAGLCAHRISVKGPDARREAGGR